MFKKLLEKIFSKSERKDINGFTIIELLVVISIIGLMASIILVSLAGMRNKARDNRIQTDLSQLRNVAEIHSTDNNGSYAGLDISNTEEDKLAADISGMQGTYVINVQAGTGVGNTYCAYSSLNRGGYWCVDSTLTSKTYTAEPNQATACTGTDSVVQKCDVTP